MKIYLVAVGRIKDEHIQKKIQEYVKRLGKGIELVVCELADGKGAPERMIEDEGKRIINHLPKSGYIVVLDEKGELLTSIDFAQLIKKVINQGRNVIFIIGGAYGLSEEVKKRADKILALSKMTFPHELARLILIEQIYRALNILQKTGYHH